jgi:hypothetical protein
MITSSFIHPASGSAFNSGRLMQSFPDFVVGWKGAGVHYIKGGDPIPRIFKYEMGAVIAIGNEIHVLPGFAQWLDLRVGTTGGRTGRDIFSILDAVFAALAYDRQRSVIQHETTQQDSI